jgi:hypothetical protein
MRDSVPTGRDRGAVGKRELEQPLDDRMHDGMDLAGERGDLELALDERAE